MRIISTIFLFVNLCLLSSFYEMQQYTMDKKKPRVIHFSGYKWVVRSTDHNQQGPGPNVFSDDKKNVWVDEQGRLHLRITKENEVWQCAEVTLSKPVGYGKYIFYLHSDLSLLDDNVVAGMFTYLNDREEIDIEFSKWGESSNKNAQFVVQPFEKEGNISRFDVKINNAPSWHSFEWRRNWVNFESFSLVDEHPYLLHFWKNSSADIPRDKQESLKINLWLYKGQAPKNLKEQELIIDSVKYVK